jgi:IS605 OrfB family transposase
LETKEYTHFKQHYAYFRAKYPTLNSAILQNSLHNVDSTIKSFISWCKKKHKIVKFPESIRPSIPLRNDCFLFEISKTDQFSVWLKFLKVWFPLNLCEYHKKSLQDFEKMADSTIIRDHKGRLCLRLVFHTKQTERSGDKTLGIDLGIAKPIVCSDGKQIGSGRYIRHRKIEFGKKRAKQASLRKEISEKQSRWTGDLNHKLSRELVEYALSSEIDVLSLEKLQGTHLACRRFRKYNWAFKDLQTKIEYKALNAGLKVVYVNPKNTSITCSVCGAKSKDNRQTQSKFQCESCGQVMNADVNAAKNIRDLSVPGGLTFDSTTGKAKGSNASFDFTNRESLSFPIKDRQVALAD